MPAIEKVTAEQVVEAYRSTGSVWKAARNLGLCGQSVWERLKAIGHPMQSCKWTEDEYAELAVLSETKTISQIAMALGRPYQAVAIKISRRGLSKRFGNRQKRKLPRGSGLTKPIVAKLIKEIDSHPDSLKSFAKLKRMDLETLVQAIQNQFPDYWKAYAEAHSDLEACICPYCEATYYPMTRKQKTCSRKCSASAKRDLEYFGGKRRNTIGLAEGVCQLCIQYKPKALSSHHLLGKANDPDNEFLIALCPGCHQLVGQLAGRNFTDHAEGWQNLVTLVMSRRMVEKHGSKYIGVNAVVEVEYLTQSDMDELDEGGWTEPITAQTEGYDGPSESVQITVSDWEG